MVDPWCVAGPDPRGSRIRPKGLGPKGEHRHFAILAIRPISTTLGSPLRGLLAPRPRDRRANDDDRPGSPSALRSGSGPIGEGGDAPAGRPKPPRRRRSVSVFWNASAISGEYLSAASFMGIAGLLMKNGYDALWYPVCYAT